VPAAWPGDGGASETAAGINALEGYLLWQAETSRARERARRFAEGLGWLSTTQREEVERAYVRDHLDHAETALRATAERCAQLRTEYREAYRSLGRRLTATFLLAMGLVVGLSALLLAVGGGG
jgi:Flp pilus assembly protein TadB